MRHLSSDDILRAAWEVQVSVHGLLSGVVIGSVETLVEPDAVVLGDLDDAEFVLVEHGPTLQAAGWGELVTRTRSIISAIRAGRRSRPAGELGQVLSQLATITQRRLPPPGQPRTN